MMVPIQNFYSKHRVNIYTMPSRVTWKSGAGSQHEKMRGHCTGVMPAILNPFLIDRSLIGTDSGKRLRIPTARLAPDPSMCVTFVKKVFLPQKFA